MRLVHNGKQHRQQEVTAQREKITSVFIMQVLLQCCSQLNSGFLQYILPIQIEFYFSENLEKNVPFLQFGCNILKLEVSSEWE